MAKKNFHTANSRKKMLEYGVHQGMGAFKERPRPVKPPILPRADQAPPVVKQDADT